LIETLNYLNTSKPFCTQMNNPFSTHCFRPSDRIDQLDFCNYLLVLKVLRNQDNLDVCTVGPKNQLFGQYNSSQWSDFLDQFFSEKNPLMN